VSLCKNETWREVESRDGNEAYYKSVEAIIRLKPSSKMRAQKQLKNQTIYASHDEAGTHLKNASHHVLEPHGLIAFEGEC